MLSCSRSGQERSLLGAFHIGRSTHAWFALRVSQLTPSGFASCSTWGDPKTALDSPLALLGETPRPLRVRPSGSPVALLGETPRPHWLTTCSTWGDPKTAVAHRSGSSTWGDTPLAHNFFGGVDDFRPTPYTLHTPWVRSPD